MWKKNMKRLQEKYSAYARDDGFLFKTLGVEFPWAKYAQMSAGLCERCHGKHNCYNTQFKQSRMPESWPMVTVANTIAHEFFHQWFGD